MKVLKVTSVCLIALMLVGTLIPTAMAEEESEGTLTLTLDRRVMPQSLLWPGRFLLTGDEVRMTVTLQDYVIRDYLGAPIEGFIIQTTSGQTRVPIETVKSIDFTGWVHRRTEDINYVENVTKADILLTNGKTKCVLMNADFGTISGKTERGDFIVSDPHTVMKLVFDR
jgi:hypothetical protein